MPDTMLKMVLLPEPFGPMRPRISPWSTLNETLLTAVKPPKTLRMQVSCSGIGLTTHLTNVAWKSMRSRIWVSSPRSRRQMFSLGGAIDRPTDAEVAGSNSCRQTFPKLDDRQKQHRHGPTVKRRRNARANALSEQFGGRQPKQFVTFLDPNRSYAHLPKKMIGCKSIPLSLT